MAKVWRVLDIIKWSTQFFEEKGIDQPRLTAEILLAHALKCRRIDLYLQFDRPLTPVERDIYRDYIKRRATGEPWQYILGTVEFYSIPLRVNKSVLIPRPETEILVEKVLDRVSDDQPYTLWDVGTGSGAIALALAKFRPQLEIVASDNSTAALDLARKNASDIHLTDRVTFILSDLDHHLNSHQFDVIVSNPPYIPSGEIADLALEIRQEPRAALDGGPDGLVFYRRLIPIAGKRLNPRGWLALEIGDTQASDVMNIIEQTSDFTEIELIQDYTQRNRIVAARKLEKV